MLTLPRLTAALLASQVPAGAGAQNPPQVLPEQRHELEPAGVVSWSELLRLDRELLRIAPRAPRSAPWPEAPPEAFLDELPARRIAPGAPLPPAAPLGSCSGHVTEPALELTFQGLPDNGTAIPPDTMGAVGPAHVMTTLNDRYRIRNRLGTVLSTVNIDTFWSSVGSGDVFDPKTLYDAAAGRWIAVACADRDLATSRVLFAMSDGGDPTGTWRFYSFDGDAADATWVDYPGVGLNSLWIAITMNMFGNNGGSFQGVKMWAIDRSTALAGGPLTVSTFPTGFDMTPGGSKGFTIQPCVTHDAAESTLYLINNNFTDASGNLLRLSRLTGTGPAPAWSVVPGSSYASGGFFQIPNDFGTVQGDAPQLGDPRLIETNDSRTLNAVLRNGSLWCTHSGERLGRTAVYWYEITPTALPAPLVQSGFIDGGSGVHHYFPSIAVNCAGDACIGFTRSRSTLHAEGVYALRLAADALGTLRPVRVLKDGEDWYYKTFGGTRNRWGDYSATLVDPVDDKTFWTHQEYARPHSGAGDDGSRWGTMWGRIGSCGQPTIDQQPSSVAACEGGTATLTIAATASNAPITFQWRKDGATLAGMIGTSLVIDPVTVGDAGTYDVLVTDGCGSLISAPASLTVNAVTITQQPASQQACPGGMVTFVVGATGANPLAYQWRKGGLDIPGETASSLTLDPVAPADAGSYTARVTDAGGCSKTSAAAALTVLEGVAIQSQPQGLTACKHLSASFAVTATGSAPLSYQWRRNGQDLPGQTASLLLISPLHTNHAGSYDVVVTNACGSVTSSPAVLVVEVCKIHPR
jgi:hypothetical protein